MKFFFYILFLFPLFACSQAGDWIWMKGDNTPNTNGSYGTKGVPYFYNTPPGMYAPGFWTDTAGNLWVYGGLAYEEKVALWKFDPNTVLWTWMNGDMSSGAIPNYAAPVGVYDSANSPGCLIFGMFTWTDKQNHLWMYGGSGNSRLSCELWQYNPVINQWAHMNGPQDLSGVDDIVFGTKGIESPTNTPGSRYESNTAWTDTAGNLWLFGGYNGNYLNDMWKYDIATGRWAWMSGSNIAGDAGHYGPIDSPSVNYYPSGRVCNLHWQDSQGNFWLAGGGSFSTDTCFVDVWKFNPSTLEWTLVKGSPTPDTVNFSSGNCQANTTNKEGGRYENRAVWKVCDNLIINYGGANYNNTHYNINNDLWAFLPQQKEWMEINEHSITGDYGLQGFASAQNYPTGRIGSCSFIDKKNNLWLFGGMDWSANLRYNDVWKFVLDTTCVGSLSCNQACNLASPTITPTATAICPTDSAQICAPANFASYTWNNNNGTGKCIQAKNAGNYYVTVTDNSGCTAESNHVSITAFPSPAVSISQSGDTLRVYNETNVQWYLNNNPIQNATQNIYIAHTFGNYTVSVTDSNGCTSFSLPTTITGIQDISNYENISIYPNPLSAGNFQLSVGNNLIGAQVEILDDNGRIVYKSEIKTTHSEIATPFAGGVYLLRITTGTGIAVRKLVKL